MLTRRYFWWLLILQENTKKPQVVASDNTRAHIQTHRELSFFVSLVVLCLPACLPFRYPYSSGTARSPAPPRETLSLILLRAAASLSRCPKAPCMTDPRYSAPPPEADLLWRKIAHMTPSYKFVYRCIIERYQKILFQHYFTPPFWISKKPKRCVTPKIISKAYYRLLRESQNNNNPDFWKIKFFFKNIRQESQKFQFRHREVTKPRFSFRFKILEHYSE